MPVARIVCPHCETLAEVQVTSVTRSRPCPNCGHAVFLQVATGEARSKRRALLIKGGDALLSAAKEETRVAGPAYEPMPLEGEVFERMKMDPEIRVFRQRLMVGAGVVLFLILTACLWSVFADRADVVSAQVEEMTPDPSPGSGQASTVPSTTSSPASSSNLLRFRGLEGTVHGDEGRQTDNLFKVVEQFLQADNLTALLDTVAARSTLEPVIRDYTARHPLKPLAYLKLRLVSDRHGQPDGDLVVSVILKDGTEQFVDLRLEQGRPRVDWASFVAWSEMEWSQFVAERPSKPVLFRVLADESATWGNAFADAKSLLCLRLTHPKNSAEVPLFAYVEKNSATGEELDFLLRQTASRPLKLTLRLRYPKDPVAADQVWIDSVVSAGWVLSNSKPRVSAVAR